MPVEHLFVEAGKIQGDGQRRACSFAGCHGVSKYASTTFLWLLASLGRL